MIGSFCSIKSFTQDFAHIAPLFVACGAEVDPISEVACFQAASLEYLNNFYDLAEQRMESATETLFEFLGIDVALPYLSVGPKSFTVKQMTKARKTAAVPKKRKAKAPSKPRKRKKKGDASLQFESMVKGALIAIKAQPCFDDLSEDKM